MERYERRDSKKLSEKRRMKKHGKTLAVVYKNALEKRK